MKEIKTVALVGLGAIGAYFTDRLQPVLGDDLRVIAGGARAERIRREGLIITANRNTTTLWSRVRASLPIW